MNKKRPKIYTLTITTWVGTAAFGAKHWYGSIKGEWNKKYTSRFEVKLERILTKEQAAKFTEEDNWRDPDANLHQWKAGETTERFDDELSVLDAARLWFQKNATREDVLFQGEHAVLNVSVVLCGPDWFGVEANRLYRKAEAIDFWEGRQDKEMEAISAEWDALILRFIKGT